MDADKPKISINLAQKELDKGRAQWTAEKERRIAEGDALNQIQLGHKARLPHSILEQ